MNIKNLLRINHILLAASLFLPFTINKLLCHSEASLSAEQARKVVSTWYKNRAAVHKGCQQQTTLTLQKTLNELTIKKELWDAYTDSQRKHYCALTVHYYEKLCQAQAANTQLSTDSDLPPELAGGAKGKKSAKNNTAVDDDLPTGIAGPDAPLNAQPSGTKGKQGQAKGASKDNAGGKAPAPEIQLCRLELGISGTAQGQSPLPEGSLADTTRTNYGYQHWIMGFGLAGSFMGAVTHEAIKPKTVQPTIEPKKEKKTKPKVESGRDDLVPIVAVLIVLLHTLSALSQIVDFLVTMAGKTFKGQVVVKLLIMIFPFLVMFDLTGVSRAVDYSYGLYLFIIFAMLNVGLLMDANDSGLKSLIRIRRSEGR